MGSLFRQSIYFVSCETTNLFRQSLKYRSPRLLLLKSLWPVPIIHTSTCIFITRVYEYPYTGRNVKSLYPQGRLHAYLYLDMCVQVPPLIYYYLYVDYQEKTGAVVVFMFVWYSYIWCCRLVGYSLISCLARCMCVCMCVCVCVSLWVSVCDVCVCVYVIVSS